MALQSRRSFGLPETWWYGIRVTVYFLAAACGVVWLAWALRLPTEPDVVQRATSVTPEALRDSPDRFGGGIVQLPETALSDLRLQETGEPVEPWSLCTLADPLSLANTLVVVGSPDGLPGCRVSLDVPADLTWKPVTDRVSGQVVAQISAPLPGQPVLRLLAETGAAPPTAETVVARIVRRNHLTSTRPSLLLPAQDGEPPTALIAVIDNGPARSTVAARTRVAIAGTHGRAWLELPRGLDALEPGPIYAEAKETDLAWLPRHGGMIDTDSATGVILAYVPIQRQQAKLRQTRRYNLFLAISLIALGLLGLVHHIQSSKQAEVEDIVLYAADAAGDVPDGDEAPRELPRVAADQVPPERAMSLEPRSRTLKDWVFATDADRRAFIRLCVVKWTGGADPAHLEQFHAFLTASVAELLREFGGDASGDTPSRQQAWMLWAPLLKNAAGVVIAETVPDEAPVLAAARYTTVHSPAFAAMMNARPLRWFVRIGAETLGVERRTPVASKRTRS